MRLTNLKIDSAKSKAKSQKLVDGNGLYLFIPASSTKPSKQTTKSWRFDFRHGKKRFTLALGLYPTISLSEARELLIAAKKQLAAGINPALEKRTRKLARQIALDDSFEAIAANWYNSKQHTRSVAWRSAHSLYLRRDLNPKIGSVPIKSIDQRMMLAILEATHDGLPPIGQPPSAHRPSEQKLLIARP